MSGKRKGQAGATPRPLQSVSAGGEQNGIEITPAMIEAGVAELNACAGAFAEVDLVRAVYTAMRRLMPQHRPLPRFASQVDPNTRRATGAE